MNNLIVQLDTTARIQGTDQTVSVTVERFESGRLFLHAITETGFDLCSHDYGYLKRTVQGNTRLRSESSMLTEMIQVADDMAKTIKRIEGTILLTTQTLQAKISGTKVFTGLASASVDYFDVCNIHSIESDATISWYAHDVYNQGPIELVFYRDDNGAPRFKATDAALYDLNKLKELHDGAAFQNSEYAFFFYNEVRRLLGMPIKGHAKRMSGFGPSERQE